MRKYVEMIALVYADSPSHPSAAGSRTPAGSHFDSPVKGAGA
jgi:hypothetical protein